MTAPPPAGVSVAVLVAGALCATGFSLALSALFCAAWDRATEVRRALSS